MTRAKGIIVLTLLLLVDIARGDVSYNIVSREDPCVNLCAYTQLPFPNSYYVKSCCERGCRFFNLVDLRYGLQPNTLNGTRDACESSCNEAYIEPQDRYACNIGCDSMAKQRVSDLLLLFSIGIYIDEGVDSNILLPDIPENDIFTDPGLRKELLPRWWDTNGFKLPQTHVKTVPIDAGTVDYGLPSDYSGENEQSASIPGSDWLQCASRHTGIPHWLLAAVIMIASLIAVWLCVATEHSSEPLEELVNKRRYGKTEVSPKAPLYVLDEAPLHKEPPPKYGDVVDVGDIDAKV